jgi:hypothetical protein
MSSRALNDVQSVRYGKERLLVREPLQGVRGVVIEAVIIHEQCNKNAWAPGSLRASLSPRERDVGLALSGVRSNTMGARSSST